MDNTRIHQQVAFLMELDKLKAVYRRSYLAAAPDRKENDAEHMWHISLMALVLQEYCPVPIKIDSVIGILLVHDVVEIDAGDVSVYLRQNDPAVAEREAAAASRIFGLLPADQGPQYLVRWNEFEAALTNEARFARAVDRLMPVLLNYHTEGRTWQDVKAVYEQVTAINRKAIEEISPQLWAYTRQIIDESLAKGYLKSNQTPVKITAAICQRQSLPAQERMQKQFAFLLEMDRLKTVYRRAFLAADPSRRENDAEHSWHSAVGAAILQEYAPSGTNIDQAVRMLLVHDIVEIDAGDTSIYERPNPQLIAEKEAAAAERLFGLLPDDQRDRFSALWKEFEAKLSPESKYAGAIDRLFPLLHNYFTQGKRWKEDRITYQQVLAVNQKLAETSPRLWEYAQFLIEESRERGYLRDGAR